MGLSVQVRAGALVLACLAAGLWLVGLRAEHAVGWALLAGALAGAVWAVLFVDWEPEEKDHDGDARPTT